MENASTVQQWRSTVTWRMHKVQVMLGLGLVVVLGGLVGLNPLIGMLSALVLLLLALVLPRPILIVYGLTFILPLVGGLARGAVVPFLRVGQALLVIGFIYFVLARPGRQSKSYLTVIDLAFLIFMLAEAIFPVLALYYRGESLSFDSATGVSPFQTLLGPLQSYLLYRLVVATASSERQIKIILNLLFLSSIIVSLIGILQKLGVSFVTTFLETYYPIPLATGFNVGYNVSDTYQRVSSTLEHYSGLGAYLSFVIILVLACYPEQKQLKISRLLLIITLLLDSITLILTGTFAAWIGLVIGAILVLKLSGRLPKMIIFITLVGIVIAAIFFQPFIAARLDQQLGTGAAQGLIPQSLALRIQLWQELFLPAFSQHPIFGAGPAPLVDTIWPSEESQYMLLLIRGGLFYFFSYCLLIGVAIIACWQQIKRHSGGIYRSVAIATLAMLVSLNVMNITGEYFTYIGCTQVLWTLLAIVMASKQPHTVSIVTGCLHSTLRYKK